MSFNSVIRARVNLFGHSFVSSGQACCYQRYGKYTDSISDAINILSNGFAYRLLWSDNSVENEVLSVTVSFRGNLNLERTLQTDGT